MINFIILAVLSFYTILILKKREELKTS